MHWIIQDSNGRHYNWTALYEAVLKAGSSAEFCKTEDIGQLYSERDCAVIIGGEDFLENAKKNNSLHVKIFENTDFFRVDHYLCLWGKDYINEDLMICRPGELCFLEKGEYFIRPLYDTKCFDGGVYRLPSEAGNICRHCEVCTSAGNCVCVSSVKKILREWRSVIIAGEIVSVCQYAVNGKNCIDSENIPADIYEFCEKIVFNTNTDAPAAWVLDIAQTWEGYKVMEANIFNASNFYDCDRLKIVQKLEKALGKEKI